MQIKENELVTLHYNNGIGAVSEPVRIKEFTVKDKVFNRTRKSVEISYLKKDSDIISCAVFQGGTILITKGHNIDLSGFGKSINDSLHAVDENLILFHHISQP